MMHDGESLWWLMYKVYYVLRMKILCMMDRVDIGWWMKFMMDDVKLYDGWLMKFKMDDFYVYR